MGTLITDLVDSYSSVLLFLLLILIVYLFAVVIRFTGSISRNKKPQPLTSQAGKKFLAKVVTSSLLAGFVFGMFFLQGYSDSLYILLCCPLGITGMVIMATAFPVVMQNRLYEE